ncbi:hypothetical protein L6164_007423 [Bauhinia variegata]|uniref:Uncharacterized protein n=1 Tax=Bauhinia variegata TaxID=167791 RepID=A0ACB9PF06_BAUVA|nr:hypothetical protein L6164_007423 [Bauhinia variegata]
MDPHITVFDNVTLISTTPSLSYNVCIDLPPKLVSSGIWGSASPLKSVFTVLELQIFVIFAITYCSHFFLKRLGLPMLFSQILAGIILGPSLKIDAIQEYKKMLFPYGSQDTLSCIAMLGYTFFLFVSGVKMDFSMVTRTGRKVWAIAVFSLLVPILSVYILFGVHGATLTQALGEYTGSITPVVIAQSSCSFAVIVVLLTDLKLLNSELGRLALSSALVMDLLSSLVQGLGASVINGLMGGKLLSNLLLLAVYIVFTPLIGRPVMLWVVRHTPEGRLVNKIFIDAIILAIILLGFLALQSNQPFWGGAYVLGFVVPEGPPLGSALVNKLDFFVTWFFLPIFVTTCVMKVDLFQSYNGNLLIITVCLVLLIHFTKMLLCMGISCYCKMPKKDAFCLALILSCKGVVDVNNFILLQDAGTIPHQMGSLMVISVLIIASIVQISVKHTYDPARKYGGYQKRNIMKLKPNSELRIVACIHKPGNIAAIKNVLDLCCPTQNHPIIVDVLHLIELVGRSSPIFISHRLQENVMTGHHNYSGDILVYFDIYEHEHQGAAKVSTYTAISPLTLMHEDVCFLALDKLASMIVLPFHIRWGGDGSVESKDNNIRALNCRVLDKAPCSIVMLVSRRIHAIDASIQIAVIFFGGRDDREALCLAKRAAMGTDISLVVYHIVSADHVKSTNWEAMLDDDVLRDINDPRSSRHHNIMYEEIVADDASSTTSFVLDIANEFQFIIVGRNYGVEIPQTQGLQTWSDFPELGAIGDMLASPDLDTKASIIVVQQQRMPNQ